MELKRRVGARRTAVIRRVPPCPERPVSVAGQRLAADVGSLVKTSSLLGASPNPLHALALTPGSMNVTVHETRQSGR